MITVGGLVKTRGGYPALREHTKGDYKSLIVVDSQGKRKRPTGKSDLVKVAINDIAIVCFNVNNQFIFNIYQILDIDIENGLMQVDKLNKYAYDIPNHLTEAVELAKKLATMDEDHA